MTSIRFLLSPEAVEALAAALRDYDVLAYETDPHGVVLAADLAARSLLAAWVAAMGTK